MSATPERLLEIKEKIQKSAERKQRLEGEQAQLLKQLSEQFGCKSFAEAEKAMKDLKVKLEDLQTRCQESLEKLENEYDWDSI